MKMCQKALNNRPILIIFYIFGNRITLASYGFHGTQTNLFVFASD